MPPIREAHQLYVQSLDLIFEQIFDFFNFDRTSDELNEARKFYIENLPPMIRQQLINVAVLKDRNRIQHTLDIIKLLSDANTSQIRPTLHSTFLLAEHYEILLNALKQNNCIGLRAISIKVILEENEESVDIIQRSNLDFNYLLKNGLENNLRVLTIEGACTNTMLKMIGHHCVQLEVLNISNSWAVTDSGIEQLLLKEKRVCSCQSRERYIMDTMSLEDTSLNRCCFTLTHVIIQDTDTTLTSVFALLILVKNLASLGEFVYYNNTVGDALFTLSTYWTDESRRFKLKFLLDCYLTAEKLGAIHSLVPELSSLSTRAEQISLEHNPFKLLENVDFEFDFDLREFNVLPFLERNCENLKSISLRNQVGFINLVAIMKSCPKLEYIEGLFTAIDLLEDVQMNGLKKAYITVNSPHFLIWLLRNAPNLEVLEVSVSRFSVDAEHITNRFFKTLIALKPSCLKILRCLIIQVFENCRVSRRTIKRFIMLCPKLQVFGDFGTLLLPNGAFFNIIAFMKRFNYSIYLKKNNTYYPPIEKNILHFEPNLLSDLI